MEASKLPVGQAAEKSGDGRVLNRPGVYTDKLSGATLITSEGNEGVIQADAFVRVGYEYSGPVPPRQELQASSEAQETNKSKG